jgi:hypothetical protein
MRELDYTIRLRLYVVEIPGTVAIVCERSAGTVFQLPNPDAIYSQDEGKERRWLPSHVVCVRTVHSLLRQGE